MDNNDLLFVESEGEPQKGEIKVVPVRRNGIDTVELKLFDGSEWIDFEEILKQGEE